MAVLVFERCFNFDTTQSGNLKNLTEGFFDFDNESKTILLKFNMADSIRRNTNEKMIEF